MNLIEKIEDHTAVVGVVGLGYVGPPVAMSFVEAGFSVIGVDVDRSRIDRLKAGDSYVGDVSDEDLSTANKTGRLRFVSSYRSLKDADVILISVPTPITEGAPDLSLVKGSVTSVAKVLKPGALVVLESTTYPGTTEELVRPLLEAEGRSLGTDFHLAYSPERIDPGNPTYRFEEIPKIVGGADEASTTAAAALYQTVLPKVFTVSGTREAELAKLIENTFRHVNIALINELAVYAHEMGIDIWEAIEAAATKPFGFMAFWPSPGWGGHCIPLDPAYLSWRVRRDRAHEVRFVEVAQAVNSEMPRHVVERISSLLNDQGRAIRGARVLGIGVAYKGGTDDTRESPGLRILDNLASKGAIVEYHDPLVGQISIGGIEHESAPLGRAITDADIAVVFVKQTGIDWDVVSKARAVLDCCNALGKRGANVERL